MKIFTKKTKTDATCIINGKVSSMDDFNKLKPSDIKAIKVLKRGTAQAIKASKEGATSDVYLITTK